MTFRGKVTSKGQVVIPAELRRRHHIRPGTPVRFVERDGAILLQPITEEFIDSVRGIAAGLGLPVDIEREPDMR